MAKKSKSRNNKSSAKTASKLPANRNTVGGAELPATAFWRWVLMIGAVLAISAGIVETVTGGFGVIDRVTGFWKSPIATPTSFVEEASDESLIVVAQFDRSIGIPDSRPHEKIADEIRSTVRSLNLNNVRVETVPDFIPINGGDKAEEVGNLYNATTVIWGEETSVDVRVNLLNRRTVVRGVLLRSGEGGLRMYSGDQYVQPDNIQPMFGKNDFSVSQGIIPHDPWQPLVYSPLLLPSDNVAVVETDGTYVTTNTDPQQYIKLITTDLPSQVTFFALLPIAQVQLFNGKEQTALNLIEKALDIRTNVLLDNDGIGEVYREVARLHLSLARQQGIVREEDWQNTVLYHAQTAKARLNQSLVAGLDEPLTYYFLGLAYYVTKEYSGAVLNFNIALEQTSDDHLRVFVLHDRSLAKIELGDYQGALADANAEIRLFPEANGAYLNRSRIRFELKDYQGTIADIDKAVELTGSGTDNPDIIDYKGKAYIALKEYDKAVDTYQKLVDVVGPENRAFAESKLQEAKTLAGY